MTGFGKRFRKQRSEGDIKRVAATVRPYTMWINFEQTLPTELDEGTLFDLKVTYYAGMYAMFQAANYIQAANLPMSVATEIWNDIGSDLAVFLASLKQRADEVEQEQEQEQEGEENGVQEC